MADFDRTEQHGFVAALVRASASGLASAAAQRLLAGDESRTVAGGEDGFPQWRGALETHLGVLAAAIGARRPAIFHEHVRWSKWACAARHIPVDDLSTSLRILAEVVESELPRGAGDLAARLVRDAIGEIDRAPEEPPSCLDARAPHGRHATRYLLALLEGDRDAALGAIDEARREGISIPEIYTTILRPALEEVGRLWLLGEVHVVEEHFATATTSLVVSRLYPELPRREPCGKTVITVSVEGELHELGIRIVSDFFAMDGWRVIHLGASVPAEDLCQGVQDFHADVVALSVCLPTHLEKVEGMIRELRADPRTRSVPVLLGGRALAGHGDLWKELGADDYAASAEEAVRIARGRVGLAG